MILAERFLDSFAINKQPKKGKCPKSCFRYGGHRVGYVPIYSVLDNGSSGDIVQMMCMECEKVFKRTAFIIIDQPRTFTTPQAGRVTGDAGEAG